MGEGGVNWSTLGDMWNSRDMRDHVIKAEGWSSGSIGKNRHGDLMELVLGDPFKMQSRIFLILE